MNSTQPLTALITGGSSGIGAELAALFARDGHGLVLVARSVEELQKKAEELRSIYKADVMVIAMDLSIPAAAQKLAAELETRGIVVDALVNNAGFATYGMFAESKPEAENAMLEVNVVALTLLTRLLLPGMIERKHGYILNIASTAAFQPGPLMSVYYASKAYVLSFSEAIRNELLGTGVSVTCLCPGPTKTGFGTRAGMGKSKLFSGKLMESSTVAKAGYRGLFAGKDIVIPGLLNKIRAFSTRFASRKFAAAVTRSVQEER